MRGFQHHRHPAVHVGDQQHPCGTGPHLRHPADQPAGIDRHHALADAPPRRHRQQHRAIVDAAGVGHGAPGDEHGCGVRHPVQVALEGGVLVRQRHRHVVPAAQPRVLGAQLLNLAGHREQVSGLDRRPAQRVDRTGQQGVERCHRIRHRDPGRFGQTPVDLAQQHDAAAKADQQRQGQLGQGLAQLDRQTEHGSAPFLRLDVPRCAPASRGGVP